jgi:hypothetical protein
MSTPLQLPGNIPPGVLLAALHAGAGAGGGPPLPAGLSGGDQGYDQNEPPLQVLQDCINGLPKVISALPDPQDTQDATQALLTLTKIQTRLFQRQSQGRQQGQQ